MLGMPGTTAASDIACFKSPAYETVSHKPPPIYDYVFVSDLEPKSPSIYMELGPHPSDVSAVPPEVGKRASYSDLKCTVSCSHMYLAYWSDG